MEHCRFCLDDDKLSNLISPCNCAGSQKYIHEYCLNKWQETMITNNFLNPEIYSASQIVCCKVCKANYKKENYHKLWKHIVILVPIVSFFQHYIYTLIRFLAILALFSGFALDTFLTYLSAICIIYVILLTWDRFSSKMFENMHWVRLKSIRYRGLISRIMREVIMTIANRMKIK
ncbi:hypothetical protein SteCoe_15739 [Stentor coeruleus]|uniref:RING-CH-type domain-containing protein n=1 Tax=Stentor coeruleus TaxID=5963 RepID=A0A1R2C2Y4_9CILI|nr:hypothetical protein SteCoe_15739 [Stentor coeruleus]